MHQSNTYMLLVLLIILSTLGQIASDIYLPSIPNIAKYYSTSIRNAELTIFYYTLGFSIGALIYGPLSDKLGRKKLILASLIIGTLSTLVCALAFSIKLLLFGRLIQGLALSCCTTLSRAITKDVSKDNVQMAKLASIIGISYAIIVNLSPIIGGIIEERWHWQITFYVLFIYLILVSIMIIIKLPETNNHIHNLNFLNVILNYIKIIKNTEFLGYSLTSAAALGGLMAYLTAAPGLLQIKIGLLPQQFSYTTLILALALIFSGIFNNKFVMYFGIKALLNIAAIIMIIGASLMLLLAFICTLNLYIILIPIFIFIFGAGITFSNTSSGAISVSDKAGTSSSLYSCLQMLGGSFGSWIITLLPNDSQLSLNLLLLVFSAICLYIGIRRK